MGGLGIARRGLHNHSLRSLLLFEVHRSFVDIFAFVRCAEGGGDMGLLAVNHKVEPQNKQYSRRTKSNSCTEIKEQFIANLASFRHFSLITQIRSTVLLPAHVLGPLTEHLALHVDAIFPDKTHATKPSSDTALTAALSVPLRVAHVQLVFSVVTHS